MRRSIQKLRNCFSERRVIYWNAFFGTIVALISIGALLWNARINIPVTTPLSSVCKSRHDSDLFQTKIDNEASALLRKKEMVSKEYQKDVRTLDLDNANSKFEDTHLLLYFPYLRKVYMGHTQISTVQPLENLACLEFVTIYNTPISDIEAFGNIKTLKTLYVNKTQIVEIYALETAQQLEALNLSENRIDDFSPLKKLKNLKWLDVSDTHFHDVKLLKSMKNLESLNLENTAVTDLKGLSKLKNLRTVYLYGTQIQDTKDISHVPKVVFQKKD